MLCQFIILVKEHKLLSPVSVLWKTTRQCLCMNRCKFLHVLLLCLQEMVIDKHEGRDIPRYLAYDIIQCDGVYVGNMKFPTRLKCIEVNVIFVNYLY